MDPKLKIVTQLPLRGLWTESGPLTASRVRAVSSSDIRDLLRLDEVQFVVVDVGLKPRWIDLGDCYRFWREEAKHRVIEPGSKIPVDQLPGLYGYQASEWQSDEIASPIVVLELCH